MPLHFFEASPVFQVHAVDADGATVVRKRLRRAEVLSFVSGLEPCLIGMEWTCLEKVERHLLSLTPVFRTGSG